MRRLPILLRHTLPRRIRVPHPGQIHQYRPRRQHIRLAAHRQALHERPQRALVVLCVWICVGVSLASLRGLLLFLRFEDFLGVDVGLDVTGERGGFGGGEVLGCAEEGADACIVRGEYDDIC